MIVCYTATPARWLKNHHSMLPKYNKYMDSSTLVFLKVTTKHTANYTCKGTFENGTHFMAVSELLVGGMLQYLSTCNA